MKLDRIYTRGGDKGQTSLGDGTRVTKYHPRVRAMGGLDEGNAALGVAVIHTDNATIKKLLARVQNDLFDVGADLCRPERADEKKEPLRVTAAQVTALENDIDRFNEPLRPLTSMSSMNCCCSSPLPLGGILKSARTPVSFAAASVPF